jgi:hypothetical protein
MTVPAALQRLARTPPVAPPEPVERCELCRTPVEERHGHVVDRERRVLACACRACFLLLTHPDAARGRYRAVPARVLVDSSFAPTEEEWARLQVPVGLAFLFHDSALERWVAVYPSAAGPTQAPLPVEAWAAISAAPLVRALEPDVEALLVSARPGGTRELFLVPIDRCYALVGLVRRHWRGFSGGDVWAHVDSFLGELRDEARPLTEPGAGR